MLIYLSIKNALILLLPLLSNLTSTYYLGKIGVHSLMALGLIAPLTMMVISAGTGLSSAAGIYVGQLHGQGKYEQIKHFLMNSQLGLLGGLNCLCLLIAMILEPGIKALVTSSILEQEIYSCLITWIFGIPFLFASMIISQSLRAMGQMKSYATIVLLAALSTLLLEPLLIFGIGAFPTMGIQGIGVAFLITSLFSFTLAALLQYRLIAQYDSLPITFRTIIRNTQDLVFQSSSMILIGMQAPLVKMLIVATVAHFEPLAAGVIGLCFRLEAFILIPANAIGGSLFTLLPYRLGSGQKHIANRTLLSALLLAFITQTVIGAMILTCLPDLARLISSDSQLLASLEQYFSTMLFSYGFLAISILLSHGFNMYGYRSLALSLNLSRNLLFLLPLFYLVESQLGLAMSVFTLACINVIFGLIYLFLGYRTILHPLVCSRVIRLNNKWAITYKRYTIKLVKLG